MFMGVKTKSSGLVLPIQQLPEATWEASILIDAGGVRGKGMSPKRDGLVRRTPTDSQVIHNELDKVSA
jgi:hypothetical protein